MILCTRSTFSFFSRASILRIDVFDCKHMQVQILLALKTTWWFAVSLSLRIPISCATSHLLLRFLKQLYDKPAGQKKGLCSTISLPPFWWWGQSLSRSPMHVVSCSLIWSNPSAFQLPGSQAVIEWSETNGVILHIVKVVLRHIGNDDIYRNITAATTAPPKILGFHRTSSLSKSFYKLIWWNTFWGSS